MGLVQLSNVCRFPTNMGSLAPKSGFIWFYVVCPGADRKYAEMRFVFAPISLSTHPLWTNVKGLGEIGGLKQISERCCCKSVRAQGDSHKTIADRFTDHLFLIRNKSRSSSTQESHVFSTFGSPADEPKDRYLPDQVFEFFICSVI